ncbi:MULTISPECIES: STAS domain-containing protein [unclassified Sphingomonas]|uniref:STAS domain-containing protein n=1 Tax=unclassified Sphingomonas TaxID=196159 RepID=UPI001F5A8921|nr:MULTISPECIES: STAS domain-containing protein [unclassified Sphingomonas]
MIRIVLPAIVDLAAAVALADKLLTATAAATLDAAGVERIGVAGLQLLLCARTTADVAGVPFVIERPSEALLDAMRLIGTEQLLVPASAR